MNRMFKKKSLECFKFEQQSRLLKKSWFSIRCKHRSHWMWARRFF